MPLGIPRRTAGFAPEHLHWESFQWLVMALASLLLQPLVLHAQPLPQPPERPQPPRQPPVPPVPPRQPPVPPVPPRQPPVPPVPPRQLPVSPVPPQPNLGPLVPPRVLLQPAGVRMDCHVSALFDFETGPGLLQKPFPQASSCSVVSGPEHWPWKIHGWARACTNPDTSRYHISYDHQPSCFHYISPHVWCFKPSELWFMTAANFMMYFLAQDPAKYVFNGTFQQSILAWLSWCVTLLWHFRRWQVPWQIPRKNAWSGRFNKQQWGYNIYIILYNMYIMEYLYIYTYIYIYIAT